MMTGWQLMIFSIIFLSCNGPTNAIQSPISSNWSQDSESTEDANTTIVIVNDSTIRRNVDLKISIDEQVVFYDDILNPSNIDKEAPSIAPHKTVRLNLQEGSYQIHLVSQKGNAELKTSFEVLDKTWIWVSYEGWNRNGTEAPQKSFVLWTSQTPIRFQ